MRTVREDFQRFEQRLRLWKTSDPEVTESIYSFFQSDKTDICVRLSDVYMCLYKTTVRVDGTFQPCLRVTKAIIYKVHVAGVLRVLKALMPLPLWVESPELHPLLVELGVLPVVTTDSGLRTDSAGVVVAQWNPGEICS